jgi:hypothetical protein
LRILREADDIEGSEEFDVEEIMDSFIRERRVKYLTKWLGFPKKRDWTSEPFENFSVGGPEKLREFHKKFPDKPRDYRLSE